jgi:tetratricopeptide (TPR) repeat protein
MPRKHRAKKPALPDEVPAQVLLRGTCAHQESWLGRYTLEQGLKSCGKPVYRYQGQDKYLFFFEDEEYGRRWYAGEHANVGQAPDGWLCVIDSAQSPDRIEAIWTEFDPASSKFVAAPGVQSVELEYGEGTAFADRLAAVVDDKTKGNQAFGTGHFAVAIAHYIRAESRFDKSPRLPICSKEQAELVKVLSNKAECLLKTNVLRGANEAASKALELDPTNVKARFRRASALSGIGDKTSVRQALEDINQVLQLDGALRPARKLKENIQDQLEMHDADELSESEDEDERRRRDPAYDGLLNWIQEDKRKKERRGGGEYGDYGGGGDSDDYYDSDDDDYGNRGTPAALVNFLNSNNDSDHYSTRFGSYKKDDQDSGIVQAARAGDLEEVRRMVEHANRPPSPFELDPDADGYFSDQAPDHARTRDEDDNEEDEDEDEDGMDSDDSETVLRRPLCYLRAH